MVEALLTASGHVQDAERMLHRMCCWLVMPAYCTLSAFAETLGSMQYTKAVYYDLCKIQQAHTQAWTAGMPLMPTMKQAQEQVAAKKKKSVKECSWATGKRKKRP